MFDRKAIRTRTVSLEQWRALAAVVDEGGYARAAEALGKSQSTVSHSIQRLEEQLGTRVLRIRGRRAVLTEIGAVTLRRARVLLNESAHIERVAQTLAAGIEAEIHLAVDTVFPNQLLLPAVCAFTDLYPDTRIEIVETVISGVEQLLHRGAVQLAITPRVPQGWMGDHLLSLAMRCVAHPDHPLHHLGRPLNQEDLRQHRQLVVRESGEQRDFQGMWLGAEQRLTVSTMGTRIQALCAGLGFAWSPLLKIATELQSGLLKPLPLAVGGTRFVNLYLLLADADGAGPATRAMAGIIRSQVENCPAVLPDPGTRS
ncbi:MAG: LysR family transcriptional regulator [Gammaproteobacteria bacterium]|nr:LysR family transcriptional regulator [Gammaproteobacteria bacterium]